MLLRGLNIISCSILVCYYNTVCVQLLQMCVYTRAARTNKANNGMMDVIISVDVRMPARTSTTANKGNATYRYHTHFILQLPQIIYMVCP